MSTQRAIDAPGYPSPPRGASWGPELPGRVEIYAGSGVSGTLDALQADRVLVGSRPHDQFGYSLSADGDATGDGWPDLIVGAPYDVAGGIIFPPQSSEVGIQVGVP